MTTLRERILAAQDIASETHTVPEWDGIRIEVRGQSARDRFRTIARFSDPESGEVKYEDLYPALVVACSFDPDTGERVFDDDDLDLVATKSAGPIERLGQAAMRLSGIGTGKLDKDGNPISPSDDEGKAS